MPTADVSNPLVEIYSFQMCAPEEMREVGSGKNTTPWNEEKGKKWLLRQIGRAQCAQMQNDTPKLQSTTLWWCIAVSIERSWDTACWLRSTGHLLDTEYFSVHVQPLCRAHRLQD